jgi:autotransporter-associated beta strand protein
MTYNATTDVFTGYESPSTSSTAPAASDSSWVAITSYTVSMGSANTFLLGIAATAHDNADTLTAVFDNLGTMSSLFAPAVPRNFLPAATALSIAGGGTLDLSGGSQRVASLSDKTPGNGGSVINSSSAASVLTLSPSGGSTTFSGMIQGGGTLGTISLVTSGSGTQVLAGSNTYTGGTTVAAGTLQLGDAANNGYVQGNILDNATVAFANPAPQAYPGVISGSGCLTKTGSGTLSLTGSNTYTGPTAINAGGLVVAGSLGSTAITVGGGATLGGTGSIGGTVVVLGGSTAGTQGAINLADGTIGTLTLSDPNAADTVLTLGGLTVGNPSAFTFEVGAIADRILVTAGKVAVNPGGSLINITALSGFGPGTYDLMDFPSGQASGLGYLSLATTSVNGYPVYLQSTPTAEQLVAVPEPGALALVAAGLACGAATGLRRRRKSVTPAMLHIVSGDGYGTEGKS